MRLLLAARDWGWRDAAASTPFRSQQGVDASSRRRICPGPSGSVPRHRTLLYGATSRCMRRVEELYALPADPEVKAKGMAETLLVMRKKIFQ